MTRNHFSKRGGPYFVNDGFSKQYLSKEDYPVSKGVSIIGRVKSFFKFPRLKRDK
jgi:hypothetical protein